MELAADPRARGRALAHPRGDAVAVAVWIALIGGCAVWGALLLAGDTRLFINAPPLYGHVEVRVGAGIALALAVASALVWWGPALGERLGWRTLLAASALAAAAWPVALNLVAGPDSIGGPLESRHEYLTVVPSIESAGGFVATFIERIDSFATHVSSHPPGFPLALHALSELGLGGAGPAAALVIALAATTPVAVLIATRAVAGPQAARAAAPFLVLAPAAVWIVTSADAAFMAIGAWGVCLTVLAVSERRPRRAAGFAFAGGLVLGVACFMSFGLVLLGAIPAAVAVARGRFLPLAVAAGGALVVVGGFALAGYWWLDGLEAARGQYYDGVASVRPLWYFAIANVAAFAVATGPATAAGLARMRRVPLLWLVGGALAAVAVADLSAMSKAEVERIWLPFVPWVILACAMLPRDRPTQRRWLAGQAAVALAVQVVVVSAW